MTTTAIAALTPRRRCRVEGEVVKVVLFGRPWVHTEAEIDDGTGTLVLCFDGRKGLPGVEAGRRISAEGMPATRWGVLVMRNPIYKFSGVG